MIAKEHTGDLNDWSVYTTYNDIWSTRALNATKLFVDVGFRRSGEVKRYAVDTIATSEIINMTNM